MNKKPFLFILFLNIFVMYMVQAFGAAFFASAIHHTAVQLVMMPIVLLVLNVALAYRHPLPFYQYAVAAYGGFSSTFFVFGGTVLFLDHIPELVAGQSVLLQNVVYVLIVGMLQLSVIMTMNVMAYIIYKGYTYKKLRYTTT